MTDKEWHELCTSVTCVNTSGGHCMSELDRRRLWFAGSFVVAANCLDLAGIYFASPDLANEWNLLQRQFGLGWTGLIGAKIVGAWLAIWGYGFYLRHRSSAYPAGGADLNRFC